MCSCSRRPLLGSMIWHEETSFPASSWMVQFGPWPNMILAFGSSICSPLGGSAGVEGDATTSVETAVEQGDEIWQVAVVVFRKVPASQVVRGTLGLSTVTVAEFDL